METEEEAEKKRGRRSTITIKQVFKDKEHGDSSFAHFAHIHKNAEVKGGQWKACESMFAY